MLFWFLFRHGLLPIVLIINRHNTFLHRRGLKLDRFYCGRVAYREIFNIAGSSDRRYSGHFFHVVASRNLPHDRSVGAWGHIRTIA